MNRQPLITARRVHKAFTTARVRPPEGHVMGYLFEEAADVAVWLKTGEAPRAIHLEIMHANREWVTRPGATGLFGFGGWRLVLRYGGRDLGRAQAILWTAALDGSDMRDGEGRPFA